MGYYLNPPSAVPSRGRRISPAHDFDFASRALRPGEVLVGVYDRMAFKVAPWLHSAEEMEEFDSQYRQGAFISRDIYAIDREAANELGAGIPDPVS